MRKKWYVTEWVNGILRSRSLACSSREFATAQRLGAMRLDLARWNPADHYLISYEIISD